MSPKRILLVCSAACNDLENCLLRAGCYVMKVKNGTTAVARARRGNLDATILVSTGNEMDLTETVLNLRDVNPALEIIILADRTGPRGEVAETNTIAHAIPMTRILTSRELNHYLASSQWKGRLPKTAKL